MRRTVNVTLLALFVAVGCGAPGGVASSARRASAPNAEEDLALLDQWTPRAIEACTGAVRATGRAAAWSALDRDTPCDIEADARWTRSSIRVLADGSSEDPLCERCQYDAAARTGRCDTPFGRVSWTLDADGRESHAQADFDGDGLADGDLVVTQEGDGWTRTVETTRVEGVATTMTRRSRTSGGVSEYEVIGPDGTIARTESDGLRTVVSMDGLTTTTQCSPLGTTTRICESDDGARERLELDAEGRVRSREVDDDGDGRVDRSTLRASPDRGVATEEDWRFDLNADGILVARRVSDGLRTLELTDAVTSIEVRTVECNSD